MIQRLFPFLAWLPRLSRDDMRRDLIAGATVATVLVPQAMAYARLAGLPPVYGLYAAFLPPLVAAFWGSSRQMATGPSAMASLISAATVGAIVSPTTPEAFLNYSILLALMVGVMRVAMGLLHLGVLVNLLSMPVVIGFSNAAAIIIAGSQLHAVLGVDKSHADYFLPKIVTEVSHAMHGIDAATIGMATLALTIMLGLRRRPERVLIAVIATTVSAWGLGYQGDIVGATPRGLPALSLPKLDATMVLQLLPGAIILTLVGLMEAMSIARTIATRTKQQLDINQELIGQGLANVVGSVTSCFPVSGSFARSAINLDAGAASGLASGVASLIVMLTLLFLTPAFHYLPLATLAIVIVLAVLSLVRVHAIARAYRVSRADGLIAIATFAVTLIMAPQLHWGIIAGVVMSLGHYLRRTMRPHVAYLARHANGALVDADAHGLALDQRIAIIRFDGRLFFGAATFFEDKVLEALSRLPELRYLVLDAGGINRIDATGIDTLRRLVEDLRAADVDIFVTRVKGSVLRVLQRDGVANLIGDDHFFDWNQHALEHLWSQMEPAYRARCPLNVVTPDNIADTYSI